VTSTLLYHFDKAAYKRAYILKMWPVKLEEMKKLLLLMPLEE
jgi:hypothetical protein